MARSYDGALRQQQAAETRQAIVDAGCELLRQSPIRDWRALTVRRVADRAGVHERTVYRHFRNERGLHDAVMSRLEEKAGVDLMGLRLEDIQEAAAKALKEVARHPLEPVPHLDPTLSDASRRRHHALLTAVTSATTGWTNEDRKAAAAILDVLWSVGSYERLVAEWELGSDHAIAAVSWAIQLIEDAVRCGRRPGSSPVRTRRERRHD